MNLFILAGIVGIAVIITGVILALIFAALSGAVKENQVVVRQQSSTYNTSLTMGFEIPTQADVPEQLTAARKLAATRAASLPRGANMGIGRLGHVNSGPALAGVGHDPWTATKIAAFHTWQGVKEGPPRGGVPQQTGVVAKAKPAPTKKPSDLKPGVDYEFIEITDDMAPEAVRSARIANAKARSAAVKALKQQAQAAAMPPTAGTPGEPAVADAKKVSPAAPVATAGVPEPEYIEITDDMAPDEVRKARIANSKARSAYAKALKQAGVDPSQVTEQREHPGAAPAATEESAKAASPASPTPATGREAVAVPDDIPQPDYIEITDDMPEAEVRKARIHNSKARSAFYKALKARGLDPKDFEAQQAVVADAAAEATEAAKEAVPAPAAEAAPAASGGVAFEMPAGVSAPEYIVVTDDMPADDVRQARVQNARERSRFFKELKAAGVDPKQVPEELTQP